MNKKFTYFEIRDILNLVLFNYLDSQVVDCYRLEVLDKLKQSLSEKKEV